MTNPTKVLGASTPQVPESSPPASSRSPGDLEVSLLNRLAADSSASQQALSEPSIQAATAAIRTETERLLLKSTPKAIKTLDCILSTGSDKDKISAATLILQKSPATKESLLSSGSSLTLTPEALKTLLQGLAAFGSASLNRQPVEEAHYSIIPEDSSET